MKQEIEELDLLYGVTIYDTMLKYNNFYAVNIKERKKIYETLNNYFINLGTIKGIDSNNVIKVGLKLLESEDIRTGIKNDNINNELIDTQLKNINFKKYITPIKENELAIRYIEHDKLEKRTLFSIADENIYNCQLLYRDFVQLFMMNYAFPKKIRTMSSYNYCLNFINSINLLYYELDKVLKVDRDTLYYCGLHVLNHKYTKDLLFPNSFSTKFNLDNITRNIKQKLYSFILRAIHFINKYYNISIPKYNYNNMFASLMSITKLDSDKEIILLILKDLTIEQKVFIFKLASHLNAVDKNYDLNESELNQIHRIISVLQKNKDICIYSQITDDTYKKIIEQNALGVLEYCDNKGLELKDYIYSPEFDTQNIKLFVSFSINYKGFDYKFSLRKFNNKYAWNVKLKNGKNYKIYLYLKDDYKHIIESIMYED